MQLSLSEKSQTSTCTRNNRRFTAEAGVVIMTDPLFNYNKINGKLMDILLLVYFIITVLICSLFSDLLLDTI